MAQDTRTTQIDNLDNAEAYAASPVRQLLSLWWQGWLRFGKAAGLEHQSKIK